MNNLNFFHLKVEASKLVATHSVLKKIKTQNQFPFPLTLSFREALTDIRRKESERAARHLILYPDCPLVERHQCTQSCFCKAVVAAGYLTQQQMQHASQRYHLGMSRDGGVIFWQIDQLGQVYDGKVMYYHPDCHRDHHHKPTWVSAELKRFYQPPFDIPTSHCLFGTHLLRRSPTPALPHREGVTATESPKTTSVENSSLFTFHSSLSIVAVVEAEKTAVILSEHYPDCLWLASGGLEALRPELLFPLRGHRIILFPDTDETCTAYSRWYQVAHEASRLLGHPVYVSPLLEQRATPAQKRHKIDLVDFLFPPP
jgi:hypothetical protein